MSLHRVTVVALLVAAFSAFAQNTTVDGIAKYREALQDGNPAELWEARGEGLWKEPRGPNKVSLERCDLGLGPGVVRGAYAQLPKYFADADRVMDLETRVVWCMEEGSATIRRSAHRLGRRFEREQARDSSAKGGCRPHRGSVRHAQIAFELGRPGAQPRVFFLQLVPFGLEPRALLRDFVPVEPAEELTEVEAPPPHTADQRENDQQQRDLQPPAVLDAHGHPGRADAEGLAELSPDGAGRHHRFKASPEGR